MNEIYYKQYLNLKIQSNIINILRINRIYIIYWNIQMVLIYINITKNINKN